MKQYEGAGLLIFEQAKGWGLDLDEEQVRSLVSYAELLDGYDVANVIGTRGVREIVRDHIVDSLSCALVEGLESSSSLADVGSGGGLPGIPLKIAYPEKKVTLIESTGKKARFLAQAREVLGLQQLEIVNQRVEEVGQSGERGCFEAVTSRALARLDVVAEYCIPLLRVGGVAVAMKGRRDPEELEVGKRAAARLGAEVSRVVEAPMMGELAGKERNLMVFEKTADTPEKYPRRAGVPTQRPLGER